MPTTAIGSMWHYEKGFYERNHHQRLDRTDQRDQRLPELELTLVIGQYAQAYHLGKSRETLTQRVAN